jgi:hypothetical protein
VARFKAADWNHCEVLVYWSVRIYGLVVPDLTKLWSWTFCVQCFLTSSTRFTLCRFVKSQRFIPTKACILLDARAFIATCVLLGTSKHSKVVLLVLAVAIQSVLRQNRLFRTSLECHRRDALRAMSSIAAAVAAP